MNNKISIIVPVYNVEKYLRKCLESLVNQDYDNYEVLVINDGSPDNSKAIIEEYASKYDVIRPFNKENGGYGSVLELGIKEAQGEYILICDSDDYLANNCLSTLMQYKQDSNADLVVGAKNLVYEDNNDIVYDPSYNSDYGNLEDKKVYRREDNSIDTLYFFEPSPHAKLYKKEIVKNIKFPHKVSYTDNLIYFYSLEHSNSVVYCEKALSYYLINRQGNTRTSLKPNVIDAFIAVFESLLNQINNGSSIFYYRLFESFYDFFYRIERIDADKNIKKEKYELVYTYLEKLLQFSSKIEEKIKIFGENNAGELSLLQANSPRNIYNKMVDRKLNGSLKQKIKNIVISNKGLNKLYDIYHFNAKYYKTRNDEKIEIEDNVDCKCLFNDDYVHFFGYYVRPCIRNNHILSHRLKSNSLDYKQEVEILIDNEVISTSKSWNWQQGSMATWIDDNHIIHNDFDGTKYISKIIDINTKEVKVIDHPVYSVSSDGKFSLSVNFSRLAKLRKDYGYFNLPYSALKEDDKDGIYYVDLINNKYELFLSLKDIYRFKAKENMKNAIHKVNHIDISPNNDKAIFLHRWFVNNKKYTRLLCVDIKTKQLSLLADNDMVSHMTWYSNDKVFGYLKGNDNKDGYYFIDMNGNQKPIRNNLLVDDGHPTILNNRYIATDTYPDYTCKSKLLLIDTELNKVSVLGKFYSPKRYQNDKRCDLHPRFDSEGNSLTFDSVANGNRNIYKITIKA